MPLLAARSARVTRRPSAFAAREPDRDSTGKVLARGSEKRAPVATLPDAATGLRDASVEFNRVLQSIASDLTRHAPATVPTPGSQEQLGDPKADAQQFTEAVDGLNQALAAIHSRAEATGSLRAKVVDDLKSKATALAAATGGAISIDNTVAPTLRLNAGSLAELLGKEGAQIRPALDNLGRVSESLQESVNQAEDEESTRQEGVHAGADRERFQIHPAVKDALDRARQLHAATAALTSLPGFSRPGAGTPLAIRKAHRAYASSLPFSTTEPPKNPAGIGPDAADSG